MLPVIKYIWPLWIGLILQFATNHVFGENSAFADWVLGRNCDNGLACGGHPLLPSMWTIVTVLGGGGRQRDRSGRHAFDLRHAGISHSGLPRLGQSRAHRARPEGGLNNYKVEKWSKDEQHIETQGPLIQSTRRARSSMPKVKQILFHVAAMLQYDTSQPDLPWRDE